MFLSKKMNFVVMNKQHFFLLALGNLMVFYPLTSWAGTLVVNGSVDFTNTNWTRTVSIPKYNGSQPLTGITVTVTSEARGDYRLVNTGTTDEIFYGDPTDRGVGADVRLSSAVLSPPFSLRPVPVEPVGEGILLPGESLDIVISGFDTKSTAVSSSNFGFFTGTGSFDFTGRALSLIDVSKSGTPFTETATIQANLNVAVTYTFSDPTPVVDEPYLGAMSILALSLGGLYLKLRSCS
jgi:hypothetical protein